MADTTLRSRLKRLFSTNVIVRHAGGKKLKIADTNRVQQATRNSLVDRWSRIHTKLTTGGYGHAQAISFQAQRLALFRDYECIDGDTIIPTLDGKNLTIKQLSDKYPNKSAEFYVYSYDHINDTVRVGKAHSVRKTKTEMTYKITFDDGKYIIATANHPFLMRNGEYKRVDELQENDSVMPFYQKMFYDNRYRFVYSFSEKWKCEHKLVSEQFDRKLKDNEVIHHLDFNKENNHPDNLQIMTDSDHKSYHATKINKEILWSSENRDDHIKAIKNGVIKSKKQNPQMWEGVYNNHSNFMKENNPFRGKHHSVESNTKRSNSLKDFYDNNESKLIGENNGMFGKKRTKKEIQKMINTMGYDYVSADDIREKIIDMAKQHEVVLKKDIATELNMSNTRLHNILKRDGTNFTELKKEIYNTLNHKITSIEKYDVRDVYDMTVEKYHNFATDSCFVHNSMDNDAIISSALDIYADESTLKSEYGQVLEIRSENENINDILHNLYYDVLNIEFNLWPWVRNLPVKGDTMIPLMDGREITIKELAEEISDNPNKDIWVYSVQDTTKDIVPGKVKWCDLTRSQAEILKIWMDDETFVETTPDHEFILRNGKQVQAKDLQPGDSLMPFYTKLSTKKDSIAGYEKVYNPKTDYYKFTHRIVSHNLHRDKKRESIIDEPIHTHHCDFNKLNNDPSNLKRFLKSVHIKLHGELGKRILKRPDVMKKRKKMTDKWLRSDVHRMMVSERQQGIYPSQFKRYNESELHSDHNKIRQNSMKLSWTQGKIKNRIKLMLDESCITYICDYIRNQNQYIKLPELVNRLKNSDEFMHLYKMSNKNNNYDIVKTFNVSTLRVLLKRNYKKNYRQLVSDCIPGIQTNGMWIDRETTISNVKNHKVLRVEKSSTKSDAYCMEVVGPSGEHDRHNFAICSKNNEGHSRNGVFVSNCKYGDFYLYLDIKDKYGIVNAVPLSAYDVTRIEGEDPENPYMVQFVVEQGDARHSSNMSGQKELENYEIAHFRLLSDSNFLPYGKGMIEGGRKIWKQLSLMEDAMLIHRIMRAPEKRIFKFDIGNIPPAEVDSFMQKVTNKMKKAPVMDTATGDYNLKYNIQNLTEDFFIPVRGGDSGTSIDTLSGLTYEAVDDIEYLRNKLMASLKIPKAFLGYEEGLGSKCLHPNTEISLLGGDVKTIKEITDEFTNSGDPNWWVYSYDVNTNSIIPAKIKLAEQTRKNAELVRVHLDNGTYVDCTPDHKFVLRGGEEIQAQLLCNGDSLQAVYRRNKKIAKNGNEYEQIYQPGTGKWQWTHKMVDRYLNGEIENNGWMGERFGRQSLTIIHHKDFNRFNNSPDNLVRMRFDDHIKLHSDNWKNNEKWIDMQQKRAKLNKLPENRKKGSERQTQRIKDNPELGYKLRDSYRNMTLDERSEKCKKAYTQEMRDVLIERNKDTKSYLRLQRGYGEKYPNGVKWDTVGELNGKWVNRPTFDELVEFMRTNRDSIDVSTIYKFSKEFGLSKYIIQEVIEDNGYTIDEWMNYYWGFKDGRKKHLKYDDFVELSAGFETEESFLENSGMGKKALYTNLNRLNVGSQYWENDILASTYNHKVVKVEFLNEKIDTYNMEVDDVNHNYLLSNGIIIKNSTLAAEDVRFARTIERLQRIIISELTKIGIVHLYSQGYTDQELVNFDLALKNPSTIYEEEKIELWNNKQGLASSLMDSKIADTEWIYDNIFKFTEEEKKNVRLGIIKDQKRKFRWDQIEQEGNDPVQSNEAVGTQGSMAGQDGGGEQGGGGSPFGRTGKELDIEMPDDGWPGSGRPKEGPKYGKDSSVRGRDPLGAHDKRKASSGSPKYGLALAHYDALKKSLGKVGKEDRKILFEAGDVEQEYKNEVSSSLSNGSND